MKQFFADGWKAIPRVMRRLQGVSSMIALSDLRLSQHSGLQELGWFRSYRERIPVDVNGEPIPWFTYPAITFIEARITKDMKVLNMAADSQPSGGLSESPRLSPAKGTKSGTHA